MPQRAAAELVVLAPAALEASHAQTCARTSERRAPARRECRAILPRRYFRLAILRSTGVRLVNDLRSAADAAWKSSALVSPAMPFALPRRKPVDRVPAIRPAPPASRIEVTRNRASAGARRRPNPARRGRPSVIRRWRTRVRSGRDGRERGLLGPFETAAAPSPRRAGRPARVRIRSFCSARGRLETASQARG